MFQHVEFRKRAQHLGCDRWGYFHPDVVRDDHNLGKRLQEQGFQVPRGDVRSHGKVRDGTIDRPCLGVALVIAATAAS